SPEFRMVNEANENPAPRADSIPSGSTVTALLLNMSMTQPVTARKVESHQTPEGLVLKVIHSIMPENTGALPIAATVPTATPVRLTAVKKNGWNSAMESAASRTLLSGHPFNVIFPIRTATAIRTRPPTRRRIAPMDMLSAPAGANAFAVPTVPQSTAAIRIINGDTTVLTCKHPRY